MKAIMCQPTEIRFHWELEVLISNLISLGQKPQDIVLLFLQGGQDGPEYVEQFKHKFGVEACLYQDNRDDRSYIPSIKPYLWSEYLREDSTRQQETYLYIDSDVVFKRLPMLDRLISLSNTHWYCSDTLGYTNYSYLSSVKYADEIIPKMCDLAGITEAQLKEQNDGEGGAQWIMKNPTLDYWEDVYALSNAFWHYFESIREKTDLDELPGGIQTWTAQMFAENFSAIKHDITQEVTDELKFAWTPDMHEVNKDAILIHDSGAQGESQFFDKSNYTTKEPYSDDFSQIEPDSWSADYVREIKRAGRKLNKI